MNRAVSRESEIEVLDIEGLENLYETMGDITFDECEIMYK